MRYNKLQCDEGIEVFSKSQLLCGKPVRTLLVAEVLCHVEAVTFLWVTEPLLGESPGVFSLNVLVAVALLKWGTCFQGGVLDL